MLLSSRGGLELCRRTLKAGENNLEEVSAPRRRKGNACGKGRPLFKQS